MFHWLEEATGFVRRHRTLRAGLPVWLFSRPLGAKEVAELAGEIHHRGHRVFLVACDQDAKPVGFTRMMPASLDGLPVGDFRD
jgi:hypothetical protein